MCPRLIWRLRHGWKIVNHRSQCSKTSDFSTRRVAALPAQAIGMMKRNSQDPESGSTTCPGYRKPGCTERCWTPWQRHLPGLSTNWLLPGSPGSCLTLCGERVSGSSSPQRNYVVLHKVRCARVVHCVMRRVLFAMA